MAAQQKRYIEARGSSIEQVLGELVRCTLLEQPADPLTFMAQRLQQTAQAAGEGGGAASAGARPVGSIHKMTLAVRNPAESVAFATKFLDCAELPVPDEGLSARGVRWVRLPGGSPMCPAGELHFIPSDVDQDLGLRGGVDLNNDGVVSGDELVPISQAWFKQLVDECDEGMETWTVFANTHVGWFVDDLTPLVTRLAEAKVCFFGPVQRADGVVQVAARTSEPRAQLCAPSCVRSHVPRAPRRCTWSCRGTTTWRSTRWSTTATPPAAPRAPGPRWPSSAQPRRAPPSSAAQQHAASTQQHCLGCPAPRAPR
jgi:hypothetical protein